MLCLTSQVYHIVVSDAENKCFKTFPPARHPDKQRERQESGQDRVDPFRGARHSQPEGRVSSYGHGSTPGTGLSNLPQPPGPFRNLHVGGVQVCCRRLSLPPGKIKTALSSFVTLKCDFFIPQCHIIVF
jgi:hypothetical protein